MYLTMIILKETTIDKLYLPERIYKYRTWNKLEHKKLLTQNEIKFSSPFDCEEQHECNLPKDYDSVTEQMLYDYFYKKAPGHGYITHIQRHDIANHMVKNSPFNNNDHRLDTEKIFRQKLNEQLSIFCASPYKNNSNLWSSFAGGDSGFCVGFNTLKMFDTKEVFGGGGDVCYYPSDKPPKIRPFNLTEEETLSDMLKVIFSLPDVYDKEKEYRLFKMNMPNQKVLLNIDSFEEIILGENINPKAEKEIIEVSKTKFPNAEISKAKFNHHTKDYDFNAIS